VRNERFGNFGRDNAQHQGQRRSWTHKKTSFRVKKPIWMKHMQKNKPCFASEVSGKLYTDLNRQKKETA